MCGSLKIIDFKRYGSTGLFVKPKYGDEDFATGKNQTHQATVSFTNSNGDKTTADKTWIGHAQVEKLSTWEAQGWKKGGLDGIYSYTERVQKDGVNTDKRKTYLLGNRRIAVMHKGDVFRIVTRPATGSELLVKTRFPLIVNPSK